MSTQLTTRQEEILSFISSVIGQKGFPPTLREIGEHFGIRSTNGVNDHLKALEKKGYLRREDLKSRAMRPTARGLASVSSADPSLLTGSLRSTQLIPVLGRVAAGEPILAVEQAEDHLEMDPSLVGSQGAPVFALRIAGTSMIDDGIHDGDYVFVRQGKSARAGETVVACIEGEATVKRFYPEKDRVRLQPANSEMEPIWVEKSEARSLDILGTVVGVYRKL